MLKFRPMLRFDGIYKCKMIFYRQGLSETSEYHPYVEVICYRYIRFLRTGQTLSLYTVQPPKKIFPRVKEHMIKGKTGPISCKTTNAITGEIQLSSGSFTVLNDRITVIQPAAATEFRYDFIGVRKS